MNIRAAISRNQNSESWLNCFCCWIFCWQLKIGMHAKLKIHLQIWPIAVISKERSQCQKIKISIADGPLVHTWFSPRPIFGVKAVVIEEVWTVPRKTIQSIMIFSKVCEIFLHDKKRRGHLSSTSSCQFSPSSSCLLSYCLWMRAQKARPSFHELLMSETCTPG